MVAAPPEGSSARGRANDPEHTPSLVRHGRGKDPNFWAIVEEVPFGVTIHHVNATTDGGDIAFQQEIAVTWEDTGATLYAKALVAMEELLQKSLPVIVAADNPVALKAARGHRTFGRARSSERTAP